MIIIIIIETMELMYFCKDFHHCAEIINYRRLTYRVCSLKIVNYPYKSEHLENCHK